MSGVGVTGQEATERLLDWCDDALHEGRSVRHFEPVYKNPAALRRDVRELLAEWAALVAERDAAVESRIDAKIATNAAVLELRQAVAERDRYRDALRRIAYAPFDVNASAVSELANVKGIAADALAVSTP